jgi:hypothetical protein
MIRAMLSIKLISIYTQNGFPTYHSTDISPTNEHEKESGAGIRKHWPFQRMMCIVML